MKRSDVVEFAPRPERLIDEDREWIKGTKPRAESSVAGFEFELSGGKVVAHARRSLEVKQLPGSYRK